MAKKNKHIDLENERYGHFMSDNSFDLDVMYGRHYLQNDVNHSILLYKVNLIESQVDDLYGQAKASDKKILPPVKLFVMPTVADGNQMNYGRSEGGIARDDSGILRFGIYLTELKEHGIEIDRGDYIEYNQSGDRARYYEVESANNVTETTSRTIAGFKDYWKEIMAIPVKEDVVQFLKGDSFR